MAGNWTADRIASLAPDASSLKSGRDLATPRKWVTLGGAEGILWGECQGSGRDPYRVQIDTAEPAFKCSCPSRKFPCKHAIGLFLLSDAQPQALSAGAPPQWVSDWLTGRQQRAEKKAQEVESAPPPDPAAQAKRAAERTRKVAAGLIDLERWLEDLVRQGLASTQGQAYVFWDTPAKRLIDAQAPGVARLVREMGEIASSGDGWQDRLLDRIARVHLLIEGFKRIDTLPPSTQDDIRTLIGWTQSRDEVLQGEPVRDRWLLVGQRVEAEEKLLVQRNWLLGERTNRSALILQFSAANQPYGESFVPGTVFEADLAFFTSAWPLRAMVKQRHGAVGAVERFNGEPTIDAALGHHAEMLAAVPWLDRYPMALAAVVPVRVHNRWWLRDSDGRAIPLAPRFARAWQLAGASGGHPIALFGEWDGQVLWPLGMTSEIGFVSLDSGEGARAAVG